MIGNDIVDLKLAKTQSNWQRKGFLEKQFSESEIKEIRNSKNPFELVWLFWSMKEAAYKCYVQEFKSRFFSPKKFECSIVSNKNGFVCFDNLKYNLKFKISDSYVYSIATKNYESTIVSKLFYIDDIENQSQKTTQQLLHYFNNRQQFYKTEFGAPYLKYQQKTLQVSTSHHGNFGAFAFIKNTWK
jgi:phosphopantetheinyl transferase (holo-ACP synthase)